MLVERSADGMDETYVDTCPKLKTCLRIQEAFQEDATAGRWQFWSVMERMCAKCTERPGLTEQQIKEIYPEGAYGCKMIDKETRAIIWEGVASATGCMYQALRRRGKMLERMQPQPRLEGGQWYWGNCSWTASRPHCPTGTLEIPIDYAPYKVGDKFLGIAKIIKVQVKQIEGVWWWEFDVKEAK